MQRGGNEHDNAPGRLLLLVSHGGLSTARVCHHQKPGATLHGFSQFIITCLLARSPVPGACRLPAAVRNRC